jgi:hypothetical protein
MTPKEKAIELISKFKPYADYQEDDCFNQIEKMLINAKHCALIAVDELIKEVNNCDVGYWEKVKEEIEKF